MNYFILQIILLSFISFTAAASIGNGFEGDHVREKITLLRYRPIVADEGHFDSLNENSNGNETTAPPTVAPSSNSTTMTPTPSPTLTPTTAPPTTAEPTTATPTTTPSTTVPPTNVPPSPSPTHHRDWWKITKFVLKTVFWIVVAGLFFFAFGAAMSNRYRIYYFVRGSWYSFLRKLKSSRASGRDGSAPSSTLNDIIFSDNNLQEELLIRET